VHAISPGWIETSEYAPRSERKPARLRAKDHEQHPAGRVGKSEDIAALCTFLASDEAGFITGQNYIVDGGMTRRMIYVD
ncbi:MAG TPA: SDR family oxidoreductase, partial [Kofleriaceae bacterium]|nr:SDR family oxidoreductase [Kofleriaceae bacterium]